MKGFLLVQGVVSSMLWKLQLHQHLKNMTLQQVTRQLQSPVTVR